MFSAVWRALAFTSNILAFVFKGIPQPGNLTKIKLTFSFCSGHLNNPEVDRTRRHVWSPVLINHTTVREAEEGQRREAGEWGNKLCWETNKCMKKLGVEMPRNKFSKNLYLMFFRYDYQIIYSSKDCRKISLADIKTSSSLTLASSSGQTRLFTCENINKLTIS